MAIDGPLGGLISDGAREGGHALCASASGHVLPLPTEERRI